MKLSSDRLVENDLLRSPTFYTPPTSYTLEDIQDHSVSSLIFTLDEFGNAPLFPDMPPLQISATWDPENSGHSLDGPHVYWDGRMENALQPLDYYAYSPQRILTWQEGSQVIDDFDWSVKEDERNESGTTQPVTNSSSPGSQSNLPVAFGGSGVPQPVWLTEDIKAHPSKVHKSLTNPKSKVTDPKISSPPWIPSPPRNCGNGSMTTLQTSRSSPGTTSAESDIAHAAAAAQDGKFGGLETILAPNTGPKRGRSVDLAVISTSKEYQPRATEPSESNFTHSKNLSLRGLVSRDAVLSIDPSFEITALDDANGESDRNTGLEHENQDVTQLTTTVTSAPTNDVVKQTEGTQTPNIILRTNMDEATNLGFPHEPTELTSEPLMAASKYATPLLANVDTLHLETDGQEWDAQLQEAAAQATPDEPSEPLPPHYLGSEKAGEEIQSLEPKETAAQVIPPDLPEAPVTPLRSGQPRLEADYVSPNIQDHARNEPEAVTTDTCQGNLRYTEEQLPLTGGVMETQEQHSVPEVARMQILMVPAGDNSNIVADDSPALQVPNITTEGAKARKRFKPKEAKESSDTQAEAPARKKQKQSNIDELEEITDASGRYESTTPTASTKRPPARKSPKEAPKDMNDDVKTTHDVPETPRHMNAGSATKHSKAEIFQTPPLPTRKAVAKPAEIFFEEDTRPTKDGPAELTFDNGDTSPAAIDDFDMQEHYSDVQSSPTPLPKDIQRTPRNIVSSRELESLGSKLAPGMHLGLHLQANTPTRVRKPAELPLKSSTADNSFLLVENDSEESDAGSILPTKKKRARTASVKNTPAAKKVKAQVVVKTRAMPRAAIGSKGEQRKRADTEESDKLGRDVFPLPTIEDRQKSSITAGSEPSMAIPKASAKGKKVAATQAGDDTNQSQAFYSAYKKRHTRRATKSEEPNSASVSAAPSVVDEAHSEEPPQALGEDTDAEYTDPSVKSKTCKKTPRLPAPLKKSATPRASTPTLATTGGSPARNKFGFSPRNTHALKSLGTTTNAAAAKTPAGKGRSAKGRNVDVGCESATGGRRAASIDSNGSAAKKGKERVEAKEPERRTRRRASAVEQEEKVEEVDVNIGKRLRRKD